MTAVPDPALGNVAWRDNWTLGPGLRFELLEIATGRVWLHQDPIGRAEADAIRVPEGWLMLDAMAAAADTAYFRRSPGASEDGPLEVASVAGHRMVLVAVAVETREVAPRVRSTVVDKHHTVHFDAGRTITVLDLGDGTVLLPAFASDRPVVTALPDGWSLREVTLTGPVTAELANPARLVVVDGNGFHGPVGGGLLPGRP